MPEEKKTVDLDTSGPGADIDIEETKDEAVVDTETPKQETETDKTFENERETKLDEKKEIISMDIILSDNDIQYLRDLRNKVFDEEIKYIKSDYKNRVFW